MALGRSMTAAARRARDAAQDAASNGPLKATSEAASKSAQVLSTAYGKTKSAVTQEEAWQEVDQSLAALVDVVRTQHGLLLHLARRVEALEGRGSGDGR